MAGQSGRTQIGVQFPTLISQSGELWPEEGEHIPFPFGAQAADGVNWPPAGFDLGSDDPDMATALDSDIPPTLDLEWVQGATKYASFVIPGINWATVNPANTSGGRPTWEEHKWYAQVRNPYIAWQNNRNHWVPAYGFQYEWWRQHSEIAEFTVVATLVQGPLTLGDSALTDGEWGTRVDLTIPAWMSERMLPGSWYHWDVLSRSVVPTAQNPAEQLDPVVQFWRRGKCRVISQWTIAGSNYRA